MSSISAPTQHFSPSLTLTTMPNDIPPTRIDANFIISNSTSDQSELSTDVDKTGVRVKSCIEIIKKFPTIKNFSTLFSNAQTKKRRSGIF